MKLCADDSVEGEEVLLEPLVVTTPALVELIRADTGCIDLQALTDHDRRAEAHAIEFTQTRRTDVEPFRVVAQGFGRLHFDGAVAGYRVVAWICAQRYLLGAGDQCGSDSFGLRRGYWLRGLCERSRALGRRPLLGLRVGLEDN